MAKYKFVVRGTIVADDAAEARNSLQDITAEWSDYDADASHIKVEPKPIAGRDDDDEAKAFIGFEDEDTLEDDGDDDDDDDDDDDEEED